MIENTNTKQFYPGPILNNTLEITDFLFNDAEQIKIKHSKLDEEGTLIDVDLNYPADYEVIKVLPSDVNAAEAALTASTGQVMLKNVNVLAGEKLTVYRVSQIIQDKGYPRTGAFPAATHEGALDYLTMQNQEQKDEINRALKVPISTGEFNAAVPVPLPNRILRIDENATGFEFVPYDLDERLDTFEDTIENTLETNKTELETSFNNFKLETDEILANNKTELEGIIEDNKQEVLSIQSDYQEEMDNKFQTVSDAADKINELESAVDTAVAAADNAVAAADNAVAAADNATEQANLAIDSVQNIETTSNQLKEEIIQEAQTQIANIERTGFYMRNDKLYFINSDGEEEEFKSGGGAGLEIGDIGPAPLGIDETKGKRRYLNGQVIIQEQYQVFADKVKSAIVLYPNLACSEQDWQATVTLSAFGQCGKFVVDDVAGTIRLPKITGFIQGLNDLASLGSLVEAGLPNITGNTTGSGEGNADGAFEAGSIIYNFGPNDATYGFKPTSISFDASRSNPTYDNSNTVQPESIRYPYFIQVATGAETEDNITNTIELNNPFFFGMSQYFETEPNNLSWLKSNGQWNNSVDYASYYNWILANANASVDGFKLSTDTYTDYDYVVNTTDGTFRLPLLDGSETIANYNINNRVTKGYVTSPNYHTASKNCYVVFSGSSTSTYGTGARLFISQGDGTFVEVSGCNGASMPNLISKGIAFVPKDTSYYFISANLEYAYEYPCVGNGSLYFYVGETVQNANLINAGRIEEKLVNFIPDNRNLITSYCCPDWDNAIDYANDTTTHTAPSNGYVIINHSVTGTGIATFKINDIPVATSYAVASYRTLLNGMYCVNQGDTFSLSKVSLDDNNIQFYFKFVPMKGAN